MRYFIIALLLSGCSAHFNANSTLENAQHRANIQAGPSSSSADISTTNNLSDLEICRQIHRGLSTAKKDCEEYIRRGFPQRRER